MKKYSIVLAAIFVAMSLGASAWAIPYIPAINAGDPLYIKFNNMEQISPTNAIVLPDGTSTGEGNWGIVDLTDIALGNLTLDDQEFLRDGDNVFWNDGNSPFEITGMFYGIEVIDPAGPLLAKDGFLDLYLDTTPDANIFSALPNQRTAVNQFTNFTNGEFLVRIAFLNGAIVPNSQASITGSTVPVGDPGGFSGLARSFGVVVDVNNDGNIDAADGLWAAAFNSNYFDTLLGERTADITFKNSYDDVAAWNGVGVGGEPIFGAVSDDPARVYVVPEPGTIILLGLGLLGFTGLCRRREIA